MFDLYLSTLNTKQTVAQVKLFSFAVAGHLGKLTHLTNK